MPEKLTSDHIGWQFYNTNGDICQIIAWGSGFDKREGYADWLRVTVMPLSHNVDYYVNEKGEAITQGMPDLISMTEQEQERKPPGVYSIIFRAKRRNK